MNDCCSIASSTQDLAQLFVFGLVMSAGHCVGMCGPLVSALTFTESRSSNSAHAFTRTSVLHHGGRLAAYAAIGLVIGSIGNLVPDRASAAIWQASLAFLAAAGLVWVGLGLLRIFPMASLPVAGAISRGLARWLALSTRANSNWRRFGLGVANGLLPCGPVYTVAVTSLAAGGALRGASAMLAFGAGTVPLLVAVSLGFGLARRRVRFDVHRLSAAFALVMALQLVLRGSAALDWLPHFSFHEVVLW